MSPHFRPVDYVVLLVCSAIAFIAFAAAYFAPATPW